MTDMPEKKVVNTVRESVRAMFVARSVLSVRSDSGEVRCSEVSIQGLGQMERRVPSSTSEQPHEHGVKRTPTQKPGWSCR